MLRPAGRWRRRVAALGVSLVVTLAAGELACRLMFAEELAFTVDERSLNYRHHERLGWFPVPDSEFRLAGERTVTVRHNSRGFRDREHGPRAGPRLACLGDSFTWGYDAERDERYSDRLQQALPGWEVLNLGVSGYGTDQALLLLQDVFDELRPDVVLLVFTHTDVEDNANNVRYGGFHKPWFELGDEGPELRGVPVPVSGNHLYARSSMLRSSYVLRAFVRAGLRLVGPSPVRAAAPHERTFAILSALRTFVEARGATLVVGRETRDPRIADHLDAAGFLHVDLTGAEVYPGHGRHWTPAGHADVAARLRRFLEEHALLDA